MRWRWTAHLGLTITLLAMPVAAAAQATAGSPPAPPLRWGGDAEGGAPFVEADPRDPSHVVGFDVEIATMIAAALGRRPVFVQSTFTELDQAVRRGDFDIGLSGIEDTPARRSAVAASVPYYAFHEVLTLRAADRTRFTRLSDLRGRKVGTLSGTIAYETLLAAETADGIIAVSYEDDVHPYEDLLNGRLDAVLLDNVLADRAERRMTGLYTNPAVVRTGAYVIIASPEQPGLRDRVNDILRNAMRSGALEAIFRKWGVWNDAQPALYASLLSASPPPAGGGVAPLPSQWVMTTRYVPALLRASLITIVLSCLAMALAVAGGVTLAVARIYGSRPVAAAAALYVEVVRGTPILLQLFVIYYGLASVVRLPAFLAALLGLGLNYAAYESEIYRSSLEAVSKAQLDAAHVLGFTRWQTLRLIRGPQALRLALAPMTNDFVAMLKDSSLVSVLTVVELTKQTQIFATNLGSWVIPGVLCAALYLAMSLPLGHAARRLEARWKS